MVSLRSYQSDFIRKIRIAFSQKKRKVCCVAGCGAGKTVLASFMCASHNDKNENNYCWFLVHRQELIEQTLNTFKMFGLNTDRIFVGMYQTVSRRGAEMFRKPTLIICDEAHHILADSWKKIIDAFEDVPIVGLTATPCRSDNKPLGNAFDELCTTVSVKWLIEHKYLSNFEYYAPKIDFEEKRKGTDFDQMFITSQFMERKIYGDVLKYINPDKKTIIYCPSIPFSKLMADKINEHFANNIAVHFDGDTPNKERANIIENFRNGNIKILCNVDLIGEGFDVPDCEYCILLRPTLSLSLFIQQSMRCMRYKEGKTAMIIDMVGNCYRHGLPDDDRDWSLEFKPRLIREKNADSQDVIVRQCKKCFRVYKGNGRICPYCFNDNGKTKKQIEEDEKAELERINAVDKRNKNIEVATAKDFGELVKIGIARKYKDPVFWATKVLNARKAKEKAKEKRRAEREAKKQAKQEIRNQHSK